MPAKKASPVKKASRSAETEYLLDTLRHIEAVARTSINAVESDTMPGVHPFAPCLVPPPVIPRPFEGWCDRLPGVGHEPGRRVGADGMPRRARRSRKRAMR